MATAAAVMQCIANVLGRKVVLAKDKPALHRRLTANTDETAGNTRVTLLAHRIPCLDCHVQRCVSTPVQSHLEDSRDGGKYASQTVENKNFVDSAAEDP